jgi:hypothetical protein
MSYPYGPPPQQPGWGQPQQPQQGGWQQPPAPQQPGGWGPPQPGGWQQPQPTQPQWGALRSSRLPRLRPRCRARWPTTTPSPARVAAQALKFPSRTAPAHFGIVNRVITDADTEQQTGMGETKANVGQTFKDGRPSWC